MANGIDYNELTRLYLEYLERELLPVLQAALKKACSLDGSIWNYISQLVVAGVDAYVYGVYTPKLYKRRSRNGGLGDPRNVVVEVGDLIFDGSGCESTLEVQNIAGPGLRGSGGGSIEQDVLGGTNYKFANRDIYGQFSRPRNFYRVFDHGYSPDVAGGLVASGILDKVKKIQYDAVVYALRSALK